MPRGRFMPFGFGIWCRRAGGVRYLHDLTHLRRLSRFPSRSVFPSSPVRLLMSAAKFLHIRRNASLSQPPSILSNLGINRRSAARSHEAMCVPRESGVVRVETADRYSRGKCSPLTRGTHACHPLVMCSLRFSPACTGNTHCVEQRSKLISVQPRMRGERCDLGLMTLGRSGSAPHARG